MEQSKTLGKLLAKENITIQHGNYKTAWFDIKNRTLGLPSWADNGKDVYDLLIGHEVGHALYTPFEGWHDSPEKLEGAPRSYINVIEDARIERKIRNEYPGLVGPFLRGYKKLAQEEFFGDLSDLDFDNIRLIDKINLKAKLGSGITVPFNAEERVFFNRAMTNETFEQVVELCKEILDYTKENQPELLEQPKMPELPEDMPPFSNEEEDDNEPPQGHDDMEPQESEETDSEEKSQGGAEETDEEGEEEASNEEGEESKDGEEEKTSSESKVSANPEEITTEEDVSITDEIFRDKECGLVETKRDGTQTLHSNGVTKEIADLCVINHKTLAEQRLKTQEIYKSSGDIFNGTKDNFEQYLKTSRKNVNFAVKEFEMRKAAHQWQRATTAKSGSLDVNKVHSYKYNEDIFARVTSLADAKNHGMMMIIDYSGSMCYSMPGVIDQLMHLVQFCKAVNIPFEVYAFTTGNTNFESIEENGQWNTSENMKLFKDASLSTDNLSMPLLVSSELKKSEFKLAMHHLYIKMKSDYYYDDEMISSRNERYGSTPLNQALVVSHTLVKRFKQKHNVEKMNFVVLSDGDTNHMHVYQDKKLKDKKTDVRSYGHRGLNIIIDNKLVSLTNTGKGGTKDLLENMKKRYNTTNLGFFMADDTRHFHNRIYSAIADQQNSDEYIDFYSDEWADIKKANSAEYRKNKCVVKENALGYKEFYVIKNGKSLNTEADNLLEDLDEEASKGKISNAFKRMSKSKKTNKVLLTRFGKAVA